MSARAVTDSYWDLVTASPAETAEALDLPIDSVYEAIARGDIPATRLGGRRLHVQVQVLKTLLGADQ